MFAELAGLSHRAAARALNERGIKTATGKAWTAVQVTLFVESGVVFGPFTGTGAKSFRARDSGNVQLRSRDGAGLNRSTSFCQ